jgi:hypothetical protein
MWGPKISNNKMENINRERGHHNTKDELVLLFPSQKRLGRARIEGSRGSINRTGQIMQRGAWSRAINKQEDSLTN